MQTEGQRGPQEPTPDTEGSRSRTTTQGPKGLMSLETRTVDLACGRHGTVLVEQFRLAGSPWGEPRCGKCLAEQEAEQEAKQAGERLREAARARARRIERNLEQSRIPARFADRDFASYVPDGERAAKVLSLCADYARDFPAHKAAGQGMILCGNTGTGKTHLACAIASRVIREHAASAVYVTAGRAFRAVKDTYRKDSGRTEEEAISDFARPDLLVLDEIGVQYGSAAELNILFDIVNERYERLLPTVLISNLALPKLTEFAGERVIDRMKENGGKVIVFDGKSRRGTP